MNGPAGPNGAGGSGLGCLCSTNAGLSLTNCTVAFNTASGGTNQGQMVGGLWLAGGVMVNTLLATNSPGGNASGPIVDAGHNLSSDASCAFTNPTSLNSTDPMLGPLADNGGPTLTMALLPGSPAIGAGDPLSAPPTDQRGVPRPPGLAADIGAYEFVPPGPSLRIQLLDAAQAVVSWPLSAQGWQLLETTNAVTGPWTTNAAPVVDTSTEHTVVLDAASSCRWFRLVQ